MPPVIDAGVERDAILDRLLSLHPKAIDLSLERVLRLLDAIGNPHRSLPPVIHVAGTNGKGSLIAFLRAMLEAAGRRVHVYTSPHLVRFNERIVLAGEIIADPALTALLEELETANADAPITFFEITTAAAFLAFARTPGDVLLLETGLGGRLDATNVVDRPLLTALTRIGLDHQGYLGNSIEEIAGEKAGILKPGVPGVVGRLPSEALEQVCARAEAVGAPLWILGRDFEVESRPDLAGPEGIALGYRDREGVCLDAALPLLGDHHRENAGLALACLRRLGHRDPDALGRAAASWATARLPGRVEVVGRSPWRVVDGAHTAASARALAAAVAGLPGRRRHLVLSVSEGKDVEAILDALLPGVSVVTLTRAEPRRSLDPGELAERVGRCSPPVRIRIEPDPLRAVRTAASAAAADDLVVAAGSIYLAGAARSAWAADPGAASPPRSERPGAERVSSP
ncbi:MAG: bifunctional folylpolyglutamate synthase/dihydrofolate synthase [Myxococcota bacterium]